MKLLFENWRKFINEGLRFDHEAPFGQERDPLGPSASVARGLEAPGPTKIAKVMLKAREEKPELKDLEINSDEFVAEVSKMYPELNLEDNSNYDLVSAAIDLIEKLIEKGKVK